MNELVEQKPAPSIPRTQTPDAKILSDLATVIEKINLCTEMLGPLTSSYQVDQDESLLVVVGFLESCVPRVRDLVEAGMTGALGEDTVVKCLTVNDSLCKVLELVEHPEKCDPAPTTVPSTSTSTNEVMDSFDAFGIADEVDLLDSKPSAAASVPAAASSTLDDLLMTPNTVPAPAPAAKPATAEEKEFEDLFKV